MLLYNSLTATKEPFHLPTDRPVTLYVCGVTPYDTTHIGHARTFLVFDLLIRYLRYQGAEVAYCQNVTDVDDPLFERAKRDGVDWRELAAEQTAQLVEDYRGMNMIAPTYFPKASEEIAGMITIVERLIELGHAYEGAGNVYFSIDSDPTFGMMAHMGYDDLLATANMRGNNPDDPNKRDPLDFVLWQTGAPGDPTWESPWGLGRPGWHIECSAMATRYLGPQIDIHGGGRDLVFPHHPCEIAQTEPFTGVRPFVRFWMHAGMVWLDGEKMSKSLGNMIFARDALREHGANRLRWYLLKTHYRADFFYDRSEVTFVDRHFTRLHEALNAPSGDQPSLEVGHLKRACLEALDDDLDTPLALDLLDTMAGAIHDGASEGRDLHAAQATLRELCEMLGFRWEA